MVFVHAGDGSYLFFPGRKYVMKLSGGRVEEVDTASVCSDPYLVVIVLINGQDCFLAQPVILSRQHVLISFHSYLFNID